MALTDAEQLRLLAIEETLNDLQIAVNNLASKLQVRQLLLLKQQEIDALTEKVELLESQIAILQSRL